MKIRKMRRRKLRRPMVRRRRRRTKNSTEVKYLTIQVADLASDISYVATASDALYGPQHKFSNLFGYIAQGTARDQRVGGKIYVKFITFHLFTTGCPESNTYSVDRYLLRCIVSNTGNTRIASGSNIPDYFGHLSEANFNSLIDRSNITVYHDKTYIVDSGSFATEASGASAHCGASRRISFTVPIGHVVDYIADGTTVRNDRDFISLILLVGVPGMATATNDRQICCTDMVARAYYTDA